MDLPTCLLLVFQFHFYIFFGQLLFYSLFLLVHIFFKLLRIFSDSIFVIIQNESINVWRSHLWGINLLFTASPSGSFISYSFFHSKISGFLIFYFLLSSFLSAVQLYLWLSFFFLIPFLFYISKLLFRMPYFFII